MRDRSLVPWLVAGLVILVTILAWSHWRPEASLTRAATWQAMTSPGELSRAHAFLEGNCAACHTPVRGVEAANCIVCHADDRSLLQRQPTAFHADVRECTACHIEHGGRSNRPTQMDHAQLARLGLRQLQQEAGPDPAKKAMIDRIQPWLQSAPTADPQQEILPQEAILNCSTCHANQDPHRQFFGTDCSQCHGTTAWTIPQFRHPPPSSTECAQCHQAPPSHYMEHFNMISVRVAGKPHAQVRECFQCHQTTSWNDIKGVGWYKHH